MALSITPLSASAFAGAAFATPTVQPRMESLADLKTLATKLNPAVGYWEAP